jgi:hypothetical protein
VECAHNHDRLIAAFRDLLQTLGALALEPLVADDEHLVQEQDLPGHVGGDRKGQPGVHAGR